VVSGVSRTRSPDQTGGEKRFRTSVLQTRSSAWQNTSPATSVTSMALGARIGPLAEVAGDVFCRLTPITPTSNVCCTDARNRFQARQRMSVVAGFSRTYVAPIRCPVALAAVIGRSAFRRTAVAPVASACRIGIVAQELHHIGG
jgi:hypothetical protein